MGDNKERTLFCGNLSEKVTEELLFELFTQAGPVESAKIPKDKSGRSKNFGFVTFKHEVSVPYTVALFQGISLYGRELQLDHRTGAGPAANKFLETIMTHRLSVIGRRPAVHRRTSSYPAEQNPTRNSYYDSNTPIRDNRYDYQPRRITDRMELPQRCRTDEMFTNSQVPSYMDSRMLQLQTIQAGYGQSPFIPIYQSIPNQSYRSQRHDHRNSRSRDGRNR